MMVQVAAMLDDVPAQFINAAGAHEPAHAAAEPRLYRSLTLEPSVRGFDRR
ncbi:hypothetical protein J2X72_004371 [Phyllobacterium sp. 1468]|uniref:hypothetical protein n=1 Tax=Phyllobacterium sp. 1468 TaxID=2817759 RepID=UPI001AE73AD5|nr:hypothetical protein [Phyllobacterium sp. 1468]MDR6635557.1 hypothetical protein [Phyllobacterium sp. 1468]